jgi:hypothetical protein
MEGIVIQSVYSESMLVRSTVLFYSRAFQYKGMPSSFEASIPRSGRILGAAVRRLAMLSSLLAVAGMGLGSGSAHALVVNVRGQLWNVSTFTGSYESNSGSFFLVAFHGEAIRLSLMNLPRQWGRISACLTRCFARHRVAPRTSDAGTTFNNETQFRSGPLLHTPKAL